MTGVKISALPAVAGAQLTDFLPVVQNGVTSKESLSQVAALFNSGSVLTGFLPLTGGTMLGPLILNANPTLPLGAATKQYVDQFASGITVILSCYAGTTGNLNVVQAGAGIGATLTDNSGTFAAFSTDGVSPPLNSRILVKDQTLPQHNGVYVLTTNGDTISVPYVLTRATDYDTALEIKPGTLVAVNNGTTLATTSWLETATVVTVDTDPVLFSQFTFGPSSFLLAANNLSDLTNVAAALVNLGLGVPTGTGNVVRQTSPTLITPNLGTPSAGILTNCTGLPLTGLATPVSSGTYVPVLTNVSNITVSTSAQFQYLRIGNVVTVSGVIAITATTPGTGINIGISLPVASNIGAFTNCAGSFGPPNVATFRAGEITGDSANNRAQAFSSLAGDSVNRNWSIIFTYLII